MAVPLEPDKTQGKQHDTAQFLPAGWVPSAEERLLPPRAQGGIGAWHEGDLVPATEDRKPNLT